MDINEKTRSAADGVGGLLRTAIGISPLFAAAYMGSLKIKSNEAINLPIGKSTPIQELGRKIGATAKTVSTKQKEELDRIVKQTRESIRISLGKADGIKDLMKNTEQRNGLLQALAVTLDDPALGLDADKRMMMKSQLLEASNIGTNDHEKLVSDVLRAVEDSADHNVIQRYSQLRNDFRDVGSQLHAPTMAIPKSGVSFTQIPHTSLPSSERNYVQQIQSSLGSGYNVQVQQYTEAGADTRVAQVFERKANGDVFKTNIPLTNTGYFRSGQSARTLYSTHKGMIPFDRAAALAERRASGAELRAAIEPTSSFFVNEFSKRAQRGFVDFTDWNSFMTGHMTNVDRIAGTGDSFASHVRFQAEIKGNTVGLYNLGNVGKDQQRKALAQIGSRFPGILDPGVGAKRLMNRSDEGLTATLGFQEGSFLHTLQNVYGFQMQSGQAINRATVPLTMREHQVVGRPAMFAGPSYKIGNTGLTGGSMFNAAEEAVRTEPKYMLNAKGDRHEALRSALRDISPFGEHTSGGLGAVTLIDVKGRVQQGLGGTGMSFTGKAQMIETPHQFAFLDPMTHGYQESDIAKRLRMAGPDGITLTADELRKGAYLGETSGGQKFLPFNERMKSMHLQLAEVTEDRVAGGDRRTISVVAKAKSEMDSFKVFSLSDKSNVQVTNDVIGQFDPNVQGAIRNTLGHFGIEEASVFGMSSDMFGKGQVGFINQIAGGTRLVTRGGVSYADLQARAQKIAMGNNHVLEMFGNANQSTEYKALAHYAQGAMELMHAKGVGAEHIGMVMTGVYHGAENNSAKNGLQKESMKVLANMLWHNQPAKLKLFNEAIETGVAFGTDVMQLGESVNGYGRGRAGVEPRFAKTLQERLMGFGMDMNAAAEVTSGVYKNKIGLGKHFQLASQLLDMDAYLSGATTAGDYLSHGEKTRLTLKELTENMVKHGGKEGSLSNYLKTVKGGVVLDLDSGSPAISQAAKKAFSQGEIFLPGAEAFEASKGTLIKQADGRAASIEGQLGNTMNSLGERLMAMQAKPEGALASLNEWKDKARGLFLSTYDQLSAGKIKGGTSPTALGYDLTHGTLMRPETLERARDVFFKSRGQSVFQTAEGFASQLSDMRGATDTGDLARKARMFFTSMETGKQGSRYLGIAGAGGRHPMMTTGNVFMTQTFRHLEEVSALGGNDVFFQKIKASDVGRKILHDAFKTHDIQSFGDVAKMGKSQQKTFFKSMVENIQHFTSGQSSDLLYVPSLKTSHGDLGIGVQAFMDNDGDHALHFLFDSPSANKVMKQMRTSGDAIALHDFKVRAAFNEMSGQTKGALGDMARRLTTSGSLEERLAQDIQKEVGLSMSTGPLDVNLRGIHEAFLAHETDPLQKAYGRLLLGNLQENFVIKSKKLSVFQPVADELIKASEQLMSKGDIGPMRSFLYSIFGEQDIAKGGMRIKGQISMEGGDAALQEQFSKYFGGSNFESSYHLDDFLTRAEAHAKSAIAGGTNGNSTKGQWAASYHADQRAAFMEIAGGRGFNTASMEGFQGASVGARTETAVSAMRQGLSKIDSRMTGTLAVGALAAAAMTGMMTGGVSPDPIIMPGENPSGAVLSGLASGKLFNRQDPQVSPEQMVAPGNQYGTMAPINTGETYATRPNSYQIRGEVSSGSGLSTFNSYFSQLTGGAGRGVLSINDQRRPITRNYIDRMIGE